MKGRPILGVIAGFLFGLLLGPTLWLWGVIELASPLIWILPIVGVVFGLAMATWAPFGKGPVDEPAPDDVAPVEEADKPSEPMIQEPVSQEPVSSETMSEPPPMSAADGGDESNP